MYICHLLFLLFVDFICFVKLIESRKVLEIQGENFELAITSYKYIAILFYDQSDKGINLYDLWINTANELENWNPDCEIAMLNGDNSDANEVFEAYGIRAPSIKVFRRSKLAEYKGPTNDSVSISQFLVKDSESSIKIAQNLLQLKSILNEEIANSIVLGFFPESDIKQEESFEELPVSAWNEYSATADTLRDHVLFVACYSQDVLSGFSLVSSDLPIIYMLSEENEGLIEYSGDILEMNLSEWILRHSSPPMGELTLTSTSGELFTTQFFTAKKLKFILLLSSKDMDKFTALDNEDDEDDVLSIQETWTQLSKYFRSKALFSYMINNSVEDILDFFDVESIDSYPMIVAHDPTTDSRYKSASMKNSFKSVHLKDFVAGVISGYTKKMMKSEPLSASKSYKSLGGPVVKLVGHNLIDTVMDVNKDILLQIYAPWCQHCKRMRSTYDILARAVAPESRILIAKIDGTANDIPLSWNVKGYPVLLFFPAKNKPYNTSIPQPQLYWDAGYSLHEMVNFIQREGSFDAKSLKIATQEQLGQLLSEEETLREKYEVEDRFIKRNEGRIVYSNIVVDYLFGEVVFDGTRLHLIGLTILCITLLVLLMKSNNNVKKVKSK